MACCGLTTVDLVQHVARYPGPDEKVESLSSRFEFGGPAANAAFTAAALDGSSQLLTAVGRGAVGRIAADQIRAAGVTLIDAVDDQWDLPVSAVTISGDRRSVVSRNAADAAPLQVAVCLAGFSALLVDGHHLPLCLAAAYEARALRVPVLLDGGSWKPGLERLLPLVDAAVVSQDFRADLPDIPVAVTRGAQPLRVTAGTQRTEIEVAAVEVSDTLGAGDVFHGAWASYVGRYGMADFAAGLRYAAEVASFSCQYPGAHEWARHYRHPRSEGTDVTPQGPAGIPRLRP